jgi:hypothetical protein
MTQVALVEKANPENITLIEDGDYRFRLPDGETVEPVYAPWENANWRICAINFDPVPTYVRSVSISELGSGYTLNDTLDTSTGMSVEDATFTVTAVGPSGEVAGVIVATAGRYSEAPGPDDNVGGGTGMGAVLHLFVAEFPTLSAVYAYDSGNNVVNETKTFGEAEIDNTASVEQQRQDGLEGDAAKQTLVDKLRTATRDQIDTWLANNVTNLAEARAVLGAVIKYLATRL